MTLEEIKTYFGRDTVFKFDGTTEELTALMEQSNMGYNYIIVSYVIYFVTINNLAPDNEKIVKV